MAITPELLEAVAVRVKGGERLLHVTTSLNLNQEEYKQLASALRRRGIALKIGRPKGAGAVNPLRGGSVEVYQARYDARRGQGAAMRLINRSRHASLEVLAKEFRYNSRQRVSQVLHCFNDGKRKNSVPPSLKIKAGRLRWLAGYCHSVAAIRRVLRVGSDTVKRASLRYKISLPSGHRWRQQRAAARRESIRRLAARGWSRRAIARVKKTTEHALYQTNWRYRLGVPLQSHPLRNQER